MDESIILENISDMHAIGLQMVTMADGVQPLLDQAGIRREDWDRAAKWMIDVSNQLGPLFSPSVITDVLLSKLATLNAAITKAFDLEDSTDE